MHGRRLGGFYVTKLLNLILAVQICGNPEDLVDNSVRIFGYTEPAVEGTVVIFHCPPGLVLDGTNTSTCTENGEWEPPPHEIHCLGILVVFIVYNTSEHNTMNYAMLY